MKFTVMIDYDDIFIEFINLYNLKNDTDFKVLDFDYDEVTFAVVESNSFGDNEIIKLGIAYGKASLIYLIEGRVYV